MRGRITVVPFQLGEEVAWVQNVLLVGSALAESKPRFNKSVNRPIAHSSRSGTIRKRRRPAMR